MPLYPLLTTPQLVMPAADLVVFFLGAFAHAVPSAYPRFSSFPRLPPSYKCYLLRAVFAGHPLGFLHITCRDLEFFHEVGFVTILMPRQYLLRALTGPSVGDHGGQWPPLCWLEWGECL